MQNQFNYYHVTKHLQDPPEYTILSWIMIDSMFPFDHKNLQEKYENDTNAICDCQSHILTAEGFMG